MKLYNKQFAWQVIILILAAVLAIVIVLPEIAQAHYDEPAIFINYEKFHKQPETVVSAPNNGSRSLPSKKPQSSPGYSGRHYSKEEVKTLIIEYSAQYRIAPDTALCIAQLESGFNQFSANKGSSARGVFQYLAGTWRATDEGKSGLNVFDATANVRAAVKYMAIHKKTSPWTVATKCPPLVFL